MPQLFCITLQNDPEKFYQAVSSMPFAARQGAKCLKIQAVARRRICITP